MKKLTALVLSLSLLLSSACSLHNRVRAIPKAARSPVEAIRDNIGRMTIVLSGSGREIGFCTAFSVAPNKFMTAAHCVPDAARDFMGGEYAVQYKVDGVRAYPLKIDKDRDLAVLLVDLVKPAVVFRETPLMLFEEVNGVGYGYGYTSYLVTDNKVMLLDFVIMIEGRQSWPGTLFMGGFIGGMSGGVVLDKQGLVVGIVQAGTAQVGHGVSVATIKEFLVQ